MAAAAVRLVDELGCQLTRDHQQAPLHTLDGVDSDAGRPAAWSRGLVRA